jgi:two-component system, OmpR family, sensor kinase
VRSVIAVPLDVAHEHRGVFIACSAREDLFADADLEFLSAASRWVGAIAHRAELVSLVASEAREQGRQVAAEELIATLAHDLGNHLAPMKARVGLLKRRARKENRESDLQSFDDLDRSVDRLHRLITDLLDASRLELGIFTLEPNPVDLGRLIEETAASFATDSTPITVNAEHGTFVLADAVRLRQALENLLSNATKHSPPGTPVLAELRTKPVDHGEWASIVIADAGPGIPPELRTRLFGRFERGEGSTGLGLGLYLASRIAHAHGGTLTVDSTPGSGARFELSLPLAPTAASQRQSRPGAPRG